MKSKLLLGFTTLCFAAGTTQAATLSSSLSKIWEPCAAEIEKHCSTEKDDEAVQSCLSRREPEKGNSGFSKECQGLVWRLERA